MVSAENSREKIIPAAALIAASACLFFIKTGFLVIFFLVPLGFVCFRYNASSSWAAFGIAAGVNLIIALLSLVFVKLPAAVLILDQFFFIAIAGIFTWINAPVYFVIPGVWRMIAGSALTALIFLGIFFRRLGDEFFYDMIKSQIDALSSLYKSGSADVVQRAVMDSLTPEFVLETIKAMMLRGGALVSSVFIFWLSRQASIGLARLFRTKRGIGRLKDFHVDFRFIWALSVSLVLILACRFFKITIPEVLFWNVTVLCAILYLAQGLGILQHFASRPATPPLLRMLLSLIFIVLLFSPGINAVFLGLVILLGIAENWAPFRASGTVPDKV